MRVAIVHSYYDPKIPSGENAFVDAQVEVLAEAGIQARLFAFRTPETKNLSTYTNGALTSATGLGKKPDFEQFEPDLVHVHNTFPNLGTRWLKHLHVPFVATLHNLRPFCMAGTFYRDGKTCRACLTAASALPGVKYKCYRSRAASATCALGQGVRADALLAYSKTLVCASQEFRAEYEAAGVDPSKIVVIPHFTTIGSPTAPAVSSRKGWAYVGRLSSEKGILELVANWPKHEPLQIVGDGPLRQQVLNAISGNVSYRGSLNRAEVSTVLASVEGTVVSSRCIEAFGMIYAESIAAGTPVIALKGSSVAGMVDRDQTGIVMHDISDLPRAITAARPMFPGIEEYCKAVARTVYSKEAWLTQTTNLYRAATGL